MTKRPTTKRPTTKRPATKRLTIKRLDELLPLVPTVEDHRNSGFRAILKSISLGPVPRILDVGAGGFAGETTTVHLLDLFPGVVDAVELNAERADVLQKKLGDRVRVINADVSDYVPGAPPDLLVVDLDSNTIPMQYLEVLPKFHGLLPSGAKVISLIIYDCEACYLGEKPLLDKAGYSDQSAFMRSYFGAERLTPAKAASALRKHGWRFLGLVDKWMGAGPGLAVGWLYFSRE